MKYIKIKNNGFIEPQALHLVGASSKRNDTTKIGQFGSGNKYAMAYLLRNGYQMRVFSGVEEIAITTKKETFRGNDYEVIYINGERTSITTEMGKDWQFWQALREIYCNALDEGGCEMDFVQNIEPDETETHFYIDTKKDVVEFMGNFDNYFATNKKVLFQCDFGKIVEKSGTTSNIYRKGIRCFNSNKTSVYDYDFDDIMIDENRLVRYSWQVEEYIWRLVYQCTDKAVIKSILHNAGNSEFIEGCISDIATLSGDLSKEFIECLKENRLCPKGTAGLLKPDEVQNHIIIPTKVFQQVRGHLGKENVGAKFNVAINGAIYREVEATPLIAATINKAIDFLNECEFAIPYEIKVAIFDDKDTLGAALNGNIYLSEICIEQGVKTVITTIIEEYIHLKYEVRDETRAFQDAIITELTSYMEKKNAYLV